MKSSLGPLFLLTFLVGIGLWFGVKWFVDDTDEFAASIDSRLVLQKRSPVISDAEDANQSEQTAVTTDVQVENSDEVAELADSDGVEESVERIELDNDNGENGVELDAASKTIAEKELIVRLSEDEIRARELARRQRFQELGLITEKPRESAVAVDVSLEIPATCESAELVKEPVGLKFRAESSIVRGESLSALESLVAHYRECQSGRFILAENPLGSADASDMLKQMRLDEIKYFFIQHSIDLVAVQFPEKP